MEKRETKYIDYRFLTILETIKQTLASGKNVMSSRFGKFEEKNERPRRGSNPATGSDLMLDARRVVRFKASGVLKGKLNGKDS